MVTIEVVEDDIWAEGTRRVQGTTGKVDTCEALEIDVRKRSLLRLTGQLGNEES